MLRSMLTYWFHHLSAHVPCEEGWSRFVGLEASLGPLITVKYENQPYVRLNSPCTAQYFKITFFRAGMSGEVEDFTQCGQIAP
jgi:hypothetical protein